MALSQISASSCRPTGRKRVAVTGHDNSIYTTPLVSAWFVGKPVSSSVPKSTSVESTARSGKGRHEV